MIHRFGTLKARLVAHDWAWARENAERIATHWAARRARQPALFNGRVLMTATATLGPDRLDLDMFAVDYAPFLAHIDFGFPDPTVRNGFAMGALRARDGAFLLGRMAPHTASAGMIYFPAGSPDLGDVMPDGTIDLEGSMLREIAEETGLRVDPTALAPDWTLVRHEGQGRRGGNDGRDALIREVGLADDAETVRDAIQAHLAAEAEPELSEIVIVRGPDDLDPAVMPNFLRYYLGWRFAGEPPDDMTVAR